MTDTIVTIERNRTVIDFRFNDCFEKWTLIRLLIGEMAKGISFTEPVTKFNVTVFAGAKND